MSMRLHRAGDCLLPHTCRKCGHSALPATNRAFIVRDRPMSELGPLYTTGPRTLLREVICPVCGTLVDAQVALAGCDALADEVEAR